MAMNDASRNTPSPNARPTPLSTRREARRGAYRTHLLIATASVLTLVVALTQLPVYPSTGPVGWMRAVDPLPQLIGEMDVQEKAKEDAGAEAPDTEAPPTVQPAPAPEASTAEAEDGVGPNNRDRSPDGAMTQRSRVVPISTLKAAKNSPEIVGGLSTFYLRIHYPEKARRAGIQGRLVLSFIVDETGQTRNIRVQESLHPLCDSSAVQALRDTRFVPGRQNGKKVPVRMSLPVRFRLVGSAASDAVADKSERDADS